MCPFTIRRTRRSSSKVTELPLSGQSRKTFLYTPAAYTMQSARRLGGINELRRFPHKSAPKWCKTTSLPAFRTGIPQLVTASHPSEGLKESKECGNRSLPPEIVLIAGTRVALGAGIGLLISTRLSRRQRKATGFALAVSWDLSTIPLALMVRKKSERVEMRPVA